MKVSCKMEFDYESEEEAEAIARAVEVDNYEFVKTTLEGKKMVSMAEAESIPSLIHTLDDFLACVGIAEKVVRKE
jgi:tRNA threonylcarbamoyladenosine modification (KEOPS) complex  Pcc1 subunit